MVDLASRIAVRASFERAKLGGDVLGRFYELFLASDPEIRARFVSTDFDALKRKLNASLQVAMFASAGDRYGLSELDRVRVSHGPTELDIPSHLFPLWRDCLLKAVAELDEQFDEELAESWRLVLQPAIDSLARREEGG